MYMFSDVNRGPPLSPNSCFTEIINFVDFYGTIVAVLLWAYLVILFITLISVCILWRHKYLEDNPGSSDDYQPVN